MPSKISKKSGKPASKKTASASEAASAESGFTSLKLTQNDQTFYLSTIPVTELFPYCYVARREEDPEVGFQRNLNENRANDIADYLKQGDGSIATNIVLSAQIKAEMKWINSSKQIAYKRIKKAFLVLDGQHRLWGYHLCAKRYGKILRVPVAIYTGLDRKAEARLFIDINTTQRGVTASLLADIKELADRETPIENTLRILFDKLNSDDESPLVGRLSAARSGPGKISRVTFKRVLEGIWAGRLGTTIEKNRYPLIKNYLNAWDAALVSDEDKKLIQSPAFFEAIFELFDEIVSISIARYRDAKQPSLQKVIEPLARFDYESIPSPRTKSSYVNLLRPLLSGTDIVV